MRQTGRLGPEPGIKIAARYTLGAELARGGMGSVWSARDELEERDVAIKFDASGLLDSASRRRFDREAQALCRLSSPHVVRFLNAGSESNLSYIVMELLVGDTLRDLLRARGALSVPEVIRIVAQAALGLSAAHEANIVHRDVKPSNLLMALVDGVNQLKVIDFGIAKPAGLGTSGDGTASGIVGSPAYMSPEQARGEMLDHRTDVWALAVVAFTLLTGREPFTDTDVPATLQRICRGDARRIGELSQRLPKALDGFFRRAFAVDRTQRFQSMSELVVHFERACADDESSRGLGRVEDTRSLSLAAAPRLARPRRTWALLSAAVVGTTLVTVVAMTRPRSEHQSGADVAAPPPVSHNDPAVVTASTTGHVAFEGLGNVRSVDARTEVSAAKSAPLMSARAKQRKAVSVPADNPTVTRPKETDAPIGPSPQPEAPLEIRTVESSSLSPAESDELDRRF